MLRIWTNHHFTSELESFRKELSGHEIDVFPPSETGRSGEAFEALKTADIAFGTPDADAVLAAERVRWFQVNLAGYTPYDRDDMRRNFKENGRVFTNSSSVYVEPCAQHAFAMMLALARRLPQSFANQLGPREWRYDETRQASYLLNEQTVLILGYGTIGKRLAELLAPLNMYIYGYRRKIAGNERVPMVSDASIDDALSRADHVVNILPANPQSKDFFHARRFRKLKSGVCFYNIGRGSTVDQDALMKSLETGHVASAYLDVVDPEPLPPDHPLWTAPNCYITPHSAGGYSLERFCHVEHFVGNFRLFEKGRQLVDQIY